jgi:hypothetical protein
MRTGRRGITHVDIFIAFVVTLRCRPFAVRLVLAGLIIQALRFLSHLQVSGWFCGLNRPGLVGSTFLALPALEVVRNPTSLSVAHIWELPFLPPLLSFMVTSFLEHAAFPSTVVPSSNLWPASSTALIGLSCLGEIPVPFYQKCRSCQQSHQIHASLVLQLSYHLQLCEFR